MELRRLMAKAAAALAAVQAAPRNTRVWISNRVMPSAENALIWILILPGMLLGGNFLDYSVLADDPVKGQQLGILLIEAGVGITVTGVLLSIFHAFAARGR